MTKTNGIIVGYGDFEDELAASDLRASDSGDSGDSVSLVERCDLDALLPAPASPTPSMSYVGRALAVRAPLLPSP